MTGGWFSLTFNLDSSLSAITVHNLRRSMMREFEKFKEALFFPLVFYCIIFRYGPYCHCCFQTNCKLWFLKREVNHIVEYCVGWDASYVSDQLYCVCVDHIPDIITNWSGLFREAKIKLMYSYYEKILCIACQYIQYSSRVLSASCFIQSNCTLGLWSTSG